MATSNIHGHNAFGNPIPVATTEDGLIIFEEGQTDNIINVDEAGGGITYIGYAETGTADGDPGWQIKRVEEVVNITKIRFADGDKGYTKTWTLRTGYTF